MYPEKYQTEKGTLYISERGIIAQLIFPTITTAQIGGFPHDLQLLLWKGERFGSWKRCILFATPVAAPNSFPRHQCQSHEHNFCLLQETSDLSPWGDIAPTPTNASEEVTTGHLLGAQLPSESAPWLAGTSPNLQKGGGKKSSNVGSREGQL